MARIRRRSSPDGAVLVLTGRVTSADMRRLEHACAGALASHSPRLEIDVRNATEVDRGAEAVLERIARRGIRVRMPDHPGDASS